MNHLRKKSAIVKLNEMLAKGVSREEALDLLKTDEAEYTEEELKEIGETDLSVDPDLFSSSNNSGTSGNNGNSQPPPPAPDEKKEKEKKTKGDGKSSKDVEEAPATLNKKFEEWKVKAVYEEVTDALGKVVGKKLTGFKKDASEPIRTTSITKERADELNLQSENTLLRLYPAK